MTNKERRLEAIKKQRGEKADKVRELWAKDTPDNDLTEDEKAEVLELTKEIEKLKVDQKDAENDVALEREVIEASAAVKSEEEEISKKGVNFPQTRSEDYVPKPKGLGDQFVGSPEYKSFFGSGSVPQGEWTMPTVNLESKATLSSGGTLSGYGPYQQDVPGVIPIADQPLVVADLMPNNTATGPQIRYFKERVATNAAAGVAETAKKPESVFDFNARTQNLTKIATYVPVADEMLEDTPGIQAYLNSRLGMFIRTEEEQQLLRGAGSGSNEIEGFVDNYALNSVGTAAATGAPGTLSFGEIATAINNQRGSSYLTPDAVIMHPKQFGSILSAYDKNGQYYAGGPLAPGLYGAGRNVPLTSPRDGGWTLFNIPVHITSQIGDGTLLVGNFAQGAAVWRRGGISVQASNSHDDYFRRNQTAIRAEERVALTVYRPEAFTVLTWV